MCRSIPSKSRYADRGRLPHSLSLSSVLPIERMLAAAGPRTMEALQAWDVCFSELVRQVFVQCNDRGELLGRVRRAQQHYLAQLVQSGLGLG